ncbi:XapX domain-containing protein [Salmonella enterica subsp. enterica serovar Havana]|nr:XapX domain-containing protein [Salmonella enterica subsp. enterica serovar Havana]
MKEIILSSGIGFGIGAFFTLCRIPIPAPNVFTRGIIYCIYVYWVSCR